MKIFWLTFSTFTVGVIVYTSILRLEYPEDFQSPFPEHASPLPSPQPLEIPPQVIPPTSPIPKKIWYKLGPQGLTSDMVQWTRSCIEANPSWTPYFFTDPAADEYVANMFAYRPDIVRAYLALRIPILKADLLRYLILFAEGGMWSDLDVSCPDPAATIERWIPPQFTAQAKMVVGLEFDGGLARGIFRQFASWTILSVANSPHMMQVVDDIVRDLDRVARENNVPISGIKLDMVGDVVDFTGPRRFSHSVVDSIGRSRGTPINVDEEMTYLRDPKMIGDLLILPGYSFAALTNSYDGWTIETENDEEARVDDGEVRDQENKKEEGERAFEVKASAWTPPPPLIEHHYAGSWKNDRGGEEERS